MPPINFALLLCCGAGSNPNFSYFLWPDWRTYNTFPDEDQAVLGFLWTIYTTEEASIAQVLFGYMSGGYTAYRAVQHIGEAGAHCTDRITGIYRLMTPTDVATMGDKFTRINSVYTGDDSDPVGWYLPTGGGGGVGIG